MVNFLFFGRLEQEKGIDLIFELIKSFGQKNKFGKYDLPFELFIFGKGKYEKQLKEIMQTTNNLHFFGFQPISKIKQIAQNCDFCLMPSRFLETFGLSALEAINMNLPVIGFKKGGLENFILDDLDISKEKGDGEKEKFISMIKKVLKYSPQEISDLKQKIIKISDKFDEVEREKKVSLLIPKNAKKILLVSDFKSKIGGIETYLFKIQKNLKYMGYEVEIFGKECYGKICRILGLFLSAFNFGAYIKLKKKVKEFEPDLIWFHSILRFLGWMILFPGKCEKWWMIHDLGYFFVFPSKVFELEKFEGKFNFGNFLKTWKSPLIKKILIFPLAFCKFVYLKLLIFVVGKKIDKILVPSKFMVDFVKNIYKFPDEKIIVLPHFD